MPIDVLKRQDQAHRAASRLPPLLVEAERVAATVSQGVHGRRKTGIGETFWQFRPYHPGDPINRIDWRQTAKSDRVYVRETEWEAAQTVWLWRDRSASMGYRSAPSLPTKRQRAELLALALTILLVRGGERVGLLDGDGKSTTGRFAIERLVRQLDTAAGDTADGSLPRPVPLARYSSLVLFGDFLEDPDAVAAMMRRFADSNVRGLMVQVLDPAEEDLSFDGRVRFDGMEGEGSELVPRVETIRPTYRHRLATHRDQLATLGQSHGWRFLTHHTDRSASTALLSMYQALAPDRAG